MAQRTLAHETLSACMFGASDLVDAVAAVGEVTLTGRVLPIGGVKEKTLAARRSGVRTLIFPAGNKKDYDELTGARCDQARSQRCFAAHFQSWAPLCLCS